MGKRAIESMMDSLIADEDDFGFGCVRHFVIAPVQQSQCDSVVCSVRGRTSTAATSADDSAARSAAAKSARQDSAETKVVGKCLV